MTGWTYLDTLPSDLILNEGVLALVMARGPDLGTMLAVPSPPRDRLPHDHCGR